MDLSGQEAKFFSLIEICPFTSPLFLPVSITVSGIHRSVLEDNLDAVKHLVAAGESVNAKEEHYGFTLLHLTVMKNNVEIRDYLLSREDIEVNARTNKNETPLYIASRLGAYESVEKLIDAGADVNIPDIDNFSPLHISTEFPNICHLLLQKGADIDAVSLNGVTPLFSAIYSEDWEVMYMLLYYNADINVREKEGMTPFVFAIINGITIAQRALLDYVDDFSEIHYCSRHSGTALGLALQWSSPVIIKEMIERGADVDYEGDYSFFNYDEYIINFLVKIEDETIFKMVWKRLCCYRDRKPMDLCRLLCDIDLNFLLVVVQIIIESDNFEWVVDSFTSYGNFSIFVYYFLNYDLEEEQLAVLTYRLLEYGYRPTMDDIYYFFCQCESDELERILLYMDVGCRKYYEFNNSAYVSFMFDLHYDTEVLAVELESGKCFPDEGDLEWLLDHFHDSRLVNALLLKFSDNKSISEILNGLPKMPSLVELARNQARKYIRESFKVTNICQFYTIIDYLPLPSSIKSILTYKRKLYMVKW